LSNTLRFFDGLPPADAHAALRALRTQPIPPQWRERVRATLPASGELTPSPAERRKLEALQAVLIYHERDQVFDIKVVDAPQAAIGLHGRAILLISRPALTLVSAEQLQALGAHEVGHDFLWNDFQHVEQTGNKHARHQLELRCDGIAALTLVAMGLDPMRLPPALKKLQRFNQRGGAVLRLGIYPTLRDRERLVKTLAERVTARQPAGTSIVTAPPKLDARSWCRKGLDGATCVNSSRTASAPEITAEPVVDR
jgi:hypothetical protein